MIAQTTGLGKHRQLLLFSSTQAGVFKVQMASCSDYYYVSRPICGVCSVSGVMTSYGCQPCPTEEVIEPIRNVAIAIGIPVIAVFWFWYSWSPLFPFYGSCMSKLELLFCKKGEKKAKITNFLASCMEAVEKLRLAQYSKIFISYLQVLSSFVGFNVPWPPVILSAMMWCKTVFNVCLLSMPGVSCFWRGLQYNSKLVAYTVIPICLGFMFSLPLLVVFVLETFQGNAEKQHFLKTSAMIKDRSLNAIMLVCFLVSIVLCSNSNSMIPNC
jgi:hypothetical protein